MWLDDNTLGLIVLLIENITGHTVVFAGKVNRSIIRFVNAFESI